MHLSLTRIRAFPLAAFFCGLLPLAAAATPALQIPYPVLDPCIAGTPYHKTITATGGVPPYTWSTTGTLPPGLLFNGGVYSGTPTVVGDYTFTMTVKDTKGATVNESEEIYIAASTLGIQSTSLAALTVGTPFSFSFTGKGGNPPYTWSLSSGVPGLSMSSTGVLSGTPTQTGTFSNVVVITDSTSVQVSSKFSQKVSAAKSGSGGSSGSGSGSGGTTTPPAPLAIQITELDSLTVGTAYSRNLMGTGGVPPYTWSSTPLPAGMTLVGGVYSGTPASQPSGTAAFTVTLTDSKATQVSITYSEYINGQSSQGSSGSGGSGTSGGSSSPSPLAIGITELDPLTVGTAYSRNLMASGGTPPYTWAVSAGVMPPGMGLASGIYSGTPTTTPSGSFNFTVTLTDSKNASLSVAYEEWVNGTAQSSDGSGSGTGGGGTSGGGGGSQSSYTLSVVNGTLSGGGTSGAFAPGATVSITANAAPAGLYFQDWTGVSVTSAGATTTTLTMPASNAVVTANYYNPPAAPFPVSGHPRLWVTAQDLPRLQSWAVNSNVTYSSFQNVLQQVIANYSSFFPGAALNAVNPTPNPNYPDPGDTQGYTGLLTEENAVVFAFQSLIDPNTTNRANYAQAARNLLMYAMNQAALGQAAGLPFRDPAFPIYNRGSATGHEWPLIVDWIYPILSASDKATIQKVFMTWAADCLTASTTGGDNPGQPGLVNSLQLLPNNLPYRMASNNYFLGHARLLTMLSLCLDPADDPVVNSQQSPSQIGNTLRSYIQDATGAWLYEEFAMMGDPATVAQAYGVPNNASGAGFGLASGGLPPEGMLYGESFAYVLGQLLALQTSGFNNAAYCGPQIGLIGAPVWDRYVQGYISSLTPTSFVPPSESYLGSLYQFAGYGDMLRLYVTPDDMGSFSLLGLLDQEQGIATHVSAARWFAVNATPGGASGLVSRMTNNPWTWGITQDILYYLLLDPAAPAAPDPRPNFPTVFFDPPAGRVVAHSDWSSTNTMFDYRASWISINHQDGAGGLFELYRNGEWLTKEMSNYDNGGGGNGGTVTFHNSLGLQNWTAGSTAFQGVDLPAWLNGSEWMEGENAGDPTTVESSGANYVYASSNLTNLYNRPDFWTPANTVSDITQATRSILWLNKDYIVIYDRATSIHPGLWKRFNMSLVTAPIVNGNAAREVLASGQQLFVQTLLPASPSLTSFDGASTLSPIADLEPTRYIYQVQDPTLPTDTRFLHVLQGADPGAPMVPATHVVSTSGTAFDGAEFGSTDVWFPVANDGVFVGSTFPAGSAVHTVIVTGLAPNAGYTVSVSPGSNGSVVSVSLGGNSAVADTAGLLTVTF